MYVYMFARICKTVCSRSQNTWLNNLFTNETNPIQTLTITLIGFTVSQWCLSLVIFTLFTYSQTKKRSETISKVKCKSKDNWVHRSLFGVLMVFSHYHLMQKLVWLPSSVCLMWKLVDKHGYGSLVCKKMRLIMIGKRLLSGRFTIDTNAVKLTPVWFPTQCENNQAEFLPVHITCIVSQMLFCAC